jgi:hypothetical protein
MTTVSEKNTVPFCVNLMSQYADPTAQRSVDEFVTVKVVGEVMTTVQV